jgi:hypothetical protein
MGKPGGPETQVARSVDRAVTGTITIGAWRGYGNAIMTRRKKTKGEIYYD